jgi:hypothetical protein
MLTGGCTDRTGQDKTDTLRDLVKVKVEVLPITAHEGPEGE